MLPGIGGSELIVIAVVALIVVGPKDLPKLLRNLGRFVGKMRGMADDFRTSFEDMARQSELDDLRKEVEALRSGKSVSPLIDDLNHDIHAISNDVTNSLNPMGPHYSKGDYYSPDSDGGHETPLETTPEPLADTAPAKPKRNRAKPGKAAPVIESAADVPEIDIAEPAPKPKRARRPKVIADMGDA